MSEGFANAIIGGAETLIRSAMKSVNYVANIAGWRLSRDGDAELNDVTIRGTLLVQSPSGSFVEIFGDEVSSRVVLQPPDSVTPGVTFDPSQIFADSDGNDTNLTIAAPSVKTPFQSQIAEIDMGYQALGDESIISLRAKDIVLADDDSFGMQLRDNVADFTGLVNAVEGFTVNGEDIGKGWWSGVTDASDSAANTAEQIILQIPSATYKAGRRYRVEVQGRIAPAGAANPLMQIRKGTTLAGAICMVLGRVWCNSANEYAGPGPIKFIVGASDVTTALALTMDGGTTSVSTRHESNILGRGFNIYDDGIASRTPNLVTLT